MTETKEKKTVIKLSHPHMLYKWTSLPEYQKRLADHTRFTVTATREQRLKPMTKKEMNNTSGELRKALASWTEGVLIVQENPYITVLIDRGHLQTFYFHGNLKFYKDVPLEVEVATIQNIKLPLSDFQKQKYEDLTKKRDLILKQMKDYVKDIDQELASEITTEVKNNGDVNSVIDKGKKLEAEFKEAGIEDSAKFDHLVTELIRNLRKLKYIQQQRRTHVYVVLTRRPALTDIYNQLKDTKEPFKATIVHFARFGAYLKYGDLRLRMKNSDFTDTPNIAIQDYYDLGATLDVLPTGQCDDDKVVLFVKPVKKVNFDNSAYWNKIQRNSVLTGKIHHWSPSACYVQIAPGLDVICDYPAKFEIESGTYVKLRVTKVDKDKGLLRGKMFQLLPLYNEVKREHDAIGDTKLDLNKIMTELKSEPDYADRPLADAVAEYNKEHGIIIDDDSDDNSSSDLNSEEDRNDETDTKSVQEEK